MDCCTNCGNKLSKDSNFCKKCGKQISKVEDNKIESNKLRCPHCGSDNFDVQVVTTNRRRGCFKIFLYIFLALTVFGLLIMLLVALLRGKKTVSRKVYICKNCGREFTPNFRNNNSNNSNNSNKGASTGRRKGPIIAIIIGSIVGTIFIISFIYGIKTDYSYVDFDKYQQLNPQQLHNDYLDNELAANENYIRNYYFFEGEVYDITEGSANNYVELRYNSERDNSKIINFNIKFNSKDALSNIRKGDYVTIYCKYIEKSDEKSNEVITTYEFSSCRFRTEE